MIICFLSFVLSLLYNKYAIALWVTQEGVTKLRICCYNGDTRISLYPSHLQACIIGIQIERSV
jgi:hypothetical protein